MNTGRASSSSSFGSSAAFTCDSSRSVSGRRGRGVLFVTATHSSEARLLSAAPAAAYDAGYTLASMPEPDEPTSTALPAVLYFDPNPTTTQLAAGILQRAGFRVYPAATEDQAVAACAAPTSDGPPLGLLVIDTATSPKLATQVLTALARVPGTSDLPVVLLTSRTNPTPIPGGEDLPTVQRPFTAAALLAAVTEAVSDGERRAKPAPARRDAAASLEGDVGAVRFSSVLSLLEDERSSGTLTIEHDAMRTRFLLEPGHIAAVETLGFPEDLEGVRSTSDASESREALAERAVEACARVLQWQRGRFHFEPDAGRSASAAAAVPIAEVVLRSLARIDESEHRPSDASTALDVYVRDDGSVTRLGRYAFTREELLVLERLNGRTNVKEVARQTRLGAYQIARVIDRLRRAKIVSLRTAPTPGASS